MLPPSLSLCNVSSCAWRAEKLLFCDRNRRWPRSHSVRFCFLEFWHTHPLLWYFGFTPPAVVGSSIYMAASSLPRHGGGARDEEPFQRLHVSRNAQWPVAGQRLVAQWGQLRVLHTTNTPVIRASEQSLLVPAVPARCIYSIWDSPAVLYVQRSHGPCRRGLSKPRVVPRPGGEGGKGDKVSAHAVARLILFLGIHFPKTEQ